MARCEVQEPLVIPRTPSTTCPSPLSPPTLRLPSPLQTPSPVASYRHPDPSIAVVRPSTGAVTAARDNDKRPAPVRAFASLGLPDWVYLPKGSGVVPGWDTDSECDSLSPESTPRSICSTTSSPSLGFDSPQPAWLNPQQPLSPNHPGSKVTWGIPASTAEQGPGLQEATRWANVPLAELCSPGVSPVLPRRFNPLISAHDQGGEKVEWEDPYTTDDEDSRDEAQESSWESTPLWACRSPGSSPVLTRRFNLPCAPVQQPSSNLDQVSWDNFRGRA